MAKIEVNKDAISTIKQALRQLATNGVPVGNMIEAVKDIEEKYAESEDERVKRILHSISSKMGFHLRDIFTEEEFQCFDAWSNAWLEKKGEQILANSAKTCKNEQKPTEKQGKHDMGISEATKQKLEDNLNKALEKETPESLSEFLDEQKPVWSEEDEEIHRKCICAMRASACGFPEEEKFVEQVDNWLKSLKERYTWKPSKREKEALLWCVVHLGGADKQTLGELLEALNKL